MKVESSVDYLLALVLTSVCSADSEFNS